MHPIAKILTTALCVVSTNSLANHSDTLNLHWRDTSVSPQENFYAYANGNWQRENPIPPEYPTWGVFNVLNEKVQIIIHNMLIEIANKKNIPGSIEQKVGDFFYSGMDETEINKQGLTPLALEFARINAIKSTQDLQKTITHLQLIGVGAVFNFGSMQDYKDSTEVIGAAMQGGLGLPNRDYYLNDTPKFFKIREAYVDHIAKMLVLSGESIVNAKVSAQKIMAIETKLAKASLSNTAMRDPAAVYHMMDIESLKTLTPHFSWSEYLQALGQAKLTKINIGMPEFFKDMDSQLQNVAIDDWKAYLRWQLLDGFAAYLSKPFVDQNFKMVQILTGTEKLLPRWKRVVSTANGALGFAIGKLYVEKHFTEQSKQQVISIINNIKRALAKDLTTLSWMSPQTRKAALAKLDLMVSRVGYPDKWWDYSKLEVSKQVYVLNVIRANQFLTQRDLDKIGKPVDRDEWAMTPQTINAYYDPSMNNINLPAAILQPPLFNPNAPAAVNYGAIGFVIGHEITHGFDDQGAKFDGHGNLKNWWTAEDAVKFKAATQCLIKQFNQYKVEDLSVNGELVVGEAAADLGGLNLSYKAFHASDAFADAKIIDNLTPDQQFFLSAAHVWALNIRPEQARNLIIVDPHPPGQFRVNGSFANIPAFYNAFGITPPKNLKRCEVW